MQKTLQECKNAQLAKGDENDDILRTHLERPGPSDDNDDILKNHLERRLKADSPSAL